MNESPVVIKKVKECHGVENERDILRRFQGRTSYIRPTIDEIDELVDPNSIVLRYLDDHLYDVSGRKRLNLKEVKYVSKIMLKALNMLHENGYVHTNMKLHNVLVDHTSSNDDKGDIRFTNVALAGLGQSISVDHKYVKEGVVFGSPVWRSPESILGLPWNTSTDIWSFGLCVIGLLVGRYYNIMKPSDGATIDRTTLDDPKYFRSVLKEHYRFFGPFESSFTELAEEGKTKERIEGVLNYLATKVKLMDRRGFIYFGIVNDIKKEEVEFIIRVMKLDPRDRPTARELLQDKWFMDIEGL
ncbi:hypothetical protein K3495_g7934 [Podosphaera aphanis]|nr:hypothetical protein K3495_g7934 [Podosphaera aphanis]